MDQNGFPIQTLALGTDTNTITVTGTSARQPLPSGAGAEDIVRLACNTDAFIIFGDVTVVAAPGDALFTAGVESFKVPDGATHIAAIQESSGGIMTITELT
jgi:hypothetical protein